MSIVKTNIDQKHVGRKLGSVTFDVFEAEGGGIDFAANNLIEFEPALQHMAMLLSPQEVKMVAAIVEDMTVSVTTLFAFVRNPDQYRDMK